MNPIRALLKQNIFVNQLLSKVYLNSYHLCAFTTAPNTDTTFENNVILPEITLAKQNLKDFEITSAKTNLQKATEICCSGVGCLNQLHFVLQCYFQLHSFEKLSNSELQDITNTYETYFTKENTTEYITSQQNLLISKNLQKDYDASSKYLKILESIQKENAKTKIYTQIQKGNNVFCKKNQRENILSLYKEADQLSKANSNYLQGEIFNNLSCYYHRIGNDFLAIQTCEFAVKDENVYEKEIPLLNLATFYKENDELVKAEETYNSVVKILENKYSENHPKLADFFLDLSKLYKKMGKSVYVEGLVRKSIRIYQKHKLEDKINKANSYF